MKKFFHFLFVPAFLIIVFAQAAMPQIAVTIDNPTNTTPNLSASYTSLADAITALNSVTSMTGPVTFSLAAGGTETAPAGGYLLGSESLNSATTANKNITFTKTLVGVNPLITAFTPGTGTTDGIWKILGTDYVTINNITVQENASNTTAVMQMEWGFALLKRSNTTPFDGCQYVDIQNCNVTLNKANTAAIGIYLGNHIATATTSLVITDISDAHNNCKFNGNTISNVYGAFSLSGYAASSPYTLFDQNNEIGVTSGNTISNLGGSTVIIRAIYAIFQNGLKIANNNINSSVNGATKDVYGICSSSGTNSNVDIYANIITLTNTYGSYSGTLYGIFNAMGSNGVTNTVNIYNNIITGCNLENDHSFFTGIENGANAATTNINWNTVSSNTLGSSGHFHGIYQSAGTDNNPCNVYSNNIYGNRKTYIYGGTMFCSRMQAGNIKFYNNNIYNNSNAGDGSIYGYDLSSSSDAPESYYNNNIHDLTNTSTGSVYGLSISSHHAVISVYGNNIYNLSSAGGTVIGCEAEHSLPLNIYKNKIYNLSSTTASGIVYGAYIGGISYLPITLNMYNNYISDLKAPNASGTNAIIGIYLRGGIGGPGTISNLYNNTVFLNAASTSTTFGTSGIFKQESPPNIGDFRNNIIVNVSTPGTGGFTVAHRWSDAYNASYYASTSDKNCFYAGNPGTNRLIFYDGVTSKATIGEYKSFVSTKDAGSFSQLPPFVNISTAPYDLHINPATPNSFESGGISITTPIAVDKDYDDNWRQGEPGYTGSGTAPDVGADEFAGIRSIDDPNSFSAATSGTSQINLTFDVNGASNNVVIAYNTANSFSAPSGAPPSNPGDPFAGAYLLYNGTSSPQAHTSLLPGTAYYYKAFSYDGSTYSPGILRNATTYGPPILTTTSATKITYTSAYTGGNVSSNGGAAITEYGVCYGTSLNPDITGTKVSVSGAPSGTYERILNGLTQGQLYHIRAYAINSNGTGYGNDLTFSTVTPISSFPWTENFDALTPPVGTSNFPSGWFEQSGGWYSSDASYNVFNDPRSTPYYITNTDLATNEFIWTPKFQLTEGISYDFSFWFAGDGYSGWTGDVFYNTAQTSTGATQLGISFITSEVTSSSTYAEVKRTFVPPATGIYTFAVRINASDVPKFIGFDDFSLAVIPTTPIFSITPASKDYGDIVSGQESANQTFTIQNTGIGTITIGNGNIALTGTNANQFVLTDANVYPINLGENQTATVQVKFMPNSVGAKTANLTITDNLTDAVHNVALTGNAINNYLTPPYTQTFSSGVFHPNLWRRFVRLLAIPTTPTTTTLGWAEGDWRNVLAAVNKCAKLNIYGTTIKYWLVTPTIQLGDGSIDYQLKFNLALTTVNSTTPPDLTGTDDKFAVVISTDNGATWSSANTLSLWDNAGSANVYNNISFDGQIITISLAAYSGNVKIGFYGESTVSNADNDLFVDNVEVRQIPAVSFSQTVSGTAPLGFTGTNVTLQYTFAPESPFNLNIDLIETTPGGSPPGSLQNMLSKYWSGTVSAGTATGTYCLTLDLTGVVGINDITTVHLIKRNNSSSGWVDLGVPTNISSYPPLVTWCGLTGFSDFTLGGNVDNPLPVQLSSFTSSVINRDVKLNWITESEMNNAGFDVERAEVRSQNLEFKKIGYIPGKGNSNSPVNYMFEDNKLNSGKYNYRLKQIDNNGNFVYHALSNVVEIGLPTKFDISQNYPNPFNPVTKIDFALPLNSKVSIKLYDITGREVKTLVNDSRPAGYYTVQFNASDLSSGTYFYRIMTKSSGADYIMTKKLVLIK